MEFQVRPSPQHQHHAQEYCGMHEQNCLTNAELRLLLTANTAPEHNGLLEHLGDCSYCQNQLAELAGDSSWIEDLQISQTAPRHPDQTKAAVDETELANVMERMSARTETAITATGTPKGLSFDGLPFTQQLVAGRRFGPYEIQSRLGAGGMSVVFTAHDHVLDRQVAIKFLSAELENSKSARQRFLREAKSAAAVENDFIVPIYSADEVDGFPFLVMSLIKGQSLQQRIDTSNPLTIEQTVRIGIQITKGLKAFHSRGLVHRDLKPSNILLQKPDNRVRITDFGLAKCTDDNQLTKSGTVLGTPNYMSPEQAMGQQVDSRSDIYGLGAILYACVTGRAPFEGPTSLQILNQLRERPPHSILDLKPDTPPWLVQVIEKLMSRAPDNRYQSAGEIIDALSQHSQTTDLPSHQKTHSRRLTRIAACAIILAIAASYFLWPENSSPVVVSPPVTPIPDPIQNNVPDGSDHADFQITIKTTDNTKRVFPTLAQAVGAARNGDIIEIQGDDTHEIGNPIETAGKQLTIRSLPGSKPVLAIINTELATAVVTDNDLVLEGLTFRFNDQNKPGSVRGPRRTAIHCVSGNLHVSNCRFDAMNSQADSLDCITVENAKRCEIRNTEFYSGPLNTALSVGIIPETELKIENNLIAAGSAIELAFPVRHASEVTNRVFIDRNIISAVSGLLLALPPPQTAPLERPVPITAKGNVWDVDFLVGLAVHPIKNNEPRPELNSRLIEQLMLWHNQGTRFRVRQAYVGVSLPKQKIRMMRNLRTRDEWNALWDLNESSSVQVPVPPRQTSLHSSGLTQLGPKDFLPLLSRQPRELQQPAPETQLEFIGPGSAYTNWLLKQTSTD